MTRCQYLQLCTKHAGYELDFVTQHASKCSINEKSKIFWRGDLPLSTSYSIASGRSVLSPSLSRSHLVAAPWAWTWMSRHETDWSTEWSAWTGKSLAWIFSFVLLDAHVGLDL